MNKSSESILLAVDSDDIGRAFQEALARAGIDSVAMVRDGQAVKEFLRAHVSSGERALARAPVLVILSCRLPKISGLQALDWIRSQPFLRRLPVVALSTSADQNEINEAYDRGVNSCIVKPENLREVPQIMNSIVTYWLSMNRRPTGDDPRRISLGDATGQVYPEL